MRDRLLYVGLQTGVDNFDEGRLQAGTANQKTVHIGLLGEVAAVLLADGATVDDADVLRGLSGDVVAEPLADSGVDLLGLLGGSDLAGADGPDGLIGNDDLLPLLLGKVLGDSSKLPSNDVDGFASLTLLQGLTNAKDDVQATINGSLGLASNELVSLLKDDTTLAVSDNDPVNLSILELLNANFTGESTVGLVEDILGSNANLGVGSLAGEEEVESGGGDDDLDGGVELGLVEVLNDGGDGVSDTVHLEVTTDEELARHSG